MENDELDDQTTPSSERTTARTSGPHWSCRYWFREQCLLVLMALRLRSSFLPSAQA